MFISISTKLHDDRPDMHAPSSYGLAGSRMRMRSCEAACSASWSVSDPLTHTWLTFRGAKRPPLRTLRFAACDFAAQRGAALLAA